MSAGQAVDLRGTVLELEVESVAHGGHCVGRADGRVVFVRHALPGERVRARVTEGAGDARFLRADAIEVLTPAAGRVQPPCPYARPGECGGCDWQHADAATQRALLASVVEEQLRRVAGLDRKVQVEAPGGDGLLGWRTRMGFAVDSAGDPGLHPHRSHDVLPVRHCLIAHPDLPVVLGHQWPADRVDAVVSSEGDRLVVLDPTAEGEVPLEPGTGAVTADGRALVPGRTYVREVVHGRTFRVSAGGFWQVHPQAATTLVDAVLELADPKPGESVADLYAGVGLFSAFLGERVGGGGSVRAVEADQRAVRDARRNLHDLPQVRIERGRVDRAFTGQERLDLVVLDPPRVGARRRVVDAVATSSPDRVVHVACDPAALARDVALFAEHGYRLAALRAYALFPMTAHVECVALLRR